MTWTLLTSPWTTIALGGALGPWGEKLLGRASPTIPKALCLCGALIGTLRGTRGDAEPRPLRVLRHRNALRVL